MITSILVYDEMDGDVFFMVVTEKDEKNYRLVVIPKDAKKI